MARAANHMRSDSVWQISAPELMSLILRANPPGNLTSLAFSTASRLTDCIFLVFDGLAVWQTTIEKGRLFARRPSLFGSRAPQCLIA